MTTPTTRATGLPPGVQTAPLGKRLLAYVIDHALPGILIGISSGVALSSSVSGRGRTVLLILTIVVSLAWGLLVWRMYALTAAGPGMRVAKLQLVGYRDGRPIGWGRFALRWLVLALLSATGIGLLIMIIVMIGQPRRQGWHDLAAESVVITQRQLAPPRPAPVEAAVPSPAPTPAAAVEERTPEAVSQEADHAQTQVVPVAEPAAEAVLAGEWVLVFDDDWDFAVDGLILLGRNPQPEPGEEDAQLIKIADTTRTVSKTHLAVGVDRNGLYVMDRGSTNGSTVTTADGFSLRCTPGDVVAVDDDSIVSFGDHWFRVVSSRSRSS